MPAQVGAVVVGDGTRFKTRFLRDEDQAKRIAFNWKTQSQRGGGQAYNAPVVAVYEDGSVQGNNTAAKNYLKAQPLQSLVRPGIRIETAQKLKA